MRSLKSAFAEEALTLKKAPRPRNRASLRLSTRRWPRRQALGVLALALIVALLLALVWANDSGRLDVAKLKTGIWIENRLAAQGLYARDVIVSGQGFTSLDEVRTALSAYDREPLRRLSPRRVAQNLEALPWVSSATVQRLWPDGLTISLEEKRPMAVLHSGGRAFFVDQNGDIIADSDPSLTRGYPHFSGDGAARAAPQLLSVLGQFPDLNVRFVAGLWVSKRRWNLYLTPGVEVLLPEDKLTDSLAALLQLQRSQGLLDKDIRSLDLRGRRPLISR